MADKPVMFSRASAKRVADATRRVLSDGGSVAVTPHSGDRGKSKGDVSELWGEVVSSTALSGATNRLVYTMKMFNNPFLTTANCIPKADGTAATVEALNTTEVNNTGTLASEYACTAAATSCGIVKKIRPIKPGQTRYRLYGPYTNPGDSKTYYAFTARNDPWWGDEAT